MPVSVRLNRLPVPPGPVRFSCRAMAKLSTPTEPRFVTVTLVEPPLTENVCAVTLAGPPANDQSVTVDGL